MNINTEGTGVSLSGNNRSFTGTKGIYQERCHCSEKRTNTWNMFLKILKQSTKERTWNKGLKRTVWNSSIRNAF